MIKRIINYLLIKLKLKKEKPIYRGKTYQQSSLEFLLNIIELNEKGESNMSHAKAKHHLMKAKHHSAKAEMHAERASKAMEKEERMEPKETHIGKLKRRAGAKR